MEPTLALIPLAAPAALFAVAAWSRRRPGRDPRSVLGAARVASLGSLALAAAAAALVATRGAVTSPVLGVGQAGLALRLDALSVTMFVLVAFVGAVVVQFSRHYLAGDRRHGDFLGRLSLALGLVFLIVLAGNLVQLMAAWIGASLALHSLLVFYRDRPRAIIAGRKKLIAARIGDLCLLGAAVLLAQAFGTSDIAEIAAAARAAGSVAPVGVHVAGALLVVAALLKSAQFPFHGWLPEVMETPTPVSALLHAGMINAGGFLIVRFADVVLLSPSVMTALAAIGAFTALFASLVMLTQSTVKGTLAYSTMAQMGFMMFECGIGAFSVAVLHIVAHSLYKAHAFLSSGSAFDRASAAGSTKTSRPGALSTAVALAAAAALVAGACALLGYTLPRDGAVIALAAVLGLSVFELLARGLGNGGARLTATVAVAALGTVATFFALKLGADRALAGAVPATPGVSLGTLVVAGMTVVAFAVVSWLQVVGAGRTTEFGHRLYVLLRNGGYVHALSDRVVGGLRLRATAPASAAGTPAPTSTTFAPGPRSLDANDDLNRDAALAAADRAAATVAPLWPLSNFVAVNPFLGLLDRPFDQTARLLETTAGARLTMPRSFYADAIDEGLITRADLRAALDTSPARDALAGSPEELDRHARLADRSPLAGPTVADVAAPILRIDLPRVVAERLADWASSHFDAGTARWPSPWRELDAYAAWRRFAARDRSLDLMGLGGVSTALASSPTNADDAIADAIHLLGLPEPGLETYLQRLLHSIGGWAGHARYLEWQEELAGRTDRRVRDLLAVRLTWEAALVRANRNVANAWRIAAPEYRRSSESTERQVDLALHAAYELALQRRTRDTLEAPQASRLYMTARTAQVAFCIDVRSERYRRALESVDPGVQTLGFAGFFGFPIEWTGVADERGGAYCPALIAPSFQVREEPCDGNHDEVRDARVRWRRFAAAWKSFKSAAVSSFGFVETMGIGYGVKLATDGLGATRPAPKADEAGISKSTRARLRPALAPERREGRQLGMTLDQRVTTATAMLRGMSLTRDFAPLVVLAGHRSSTVNNPYASGLDCGACGGRSGEPNARVAAAVLNDPQVRAGLAANGIEIPARTLFVAAVHETTTDTVTVCDRDQVPTTRRPEVTALERSLATAGSLSRRERAPAMGLARAADIDASVRARATDWSQVRPEWGLAGCTSFVVAPRRRTQDRCFDGSAFLHDYSWRDDSEFAVLETIMSAPMVVTSWINLQYFASTVDNRAFGSGNKVLHNPVSGLGVVEGNGGDLRVGLPWQSVHDGTRFVHRPARLSVIIEAPTEAMSEVIARHETVRHLADNGWLTLFALGDDGRLCARYAGGLRWQAIGDEAPDLAA